MIDKAIAAAVVAVVVFTGGFATAWTWQEGKHDEYVRSQKEAVREIDAKNEARLAATARAWAETVDWLRSESGDAARKHEAYRRCVAAGRCGPAAISVQPGHCEAGTVPPAAATDGAGAGAIPAPTGEAADVCEAAVAPLIEDFIRAVAQANALMADVEAQDGY